VKHVARLSQSIDSYRILVWRPEGNIPLGRTRLRWEDTIEMNQRTQLHVVN
jgi:hypothetical protein